MQYIPHSEQDTSICMKMDTLIGMIWRSCECLKLSWIAVYVLTYEGCDKAWK